ncbi:molybdate ABC transporter substrate-binding protein [Massilia terrae]|uniref:Molybdate ABC transporter substrate-binding protein n=1 Tax=Massilia terrae TaxID=1811224 RepID=A0ABT2CUS0_9BURK|nr:molybdate ABC transporter substrate-binding protein [Massilia terrae]MCS0657720.1 molybdate ABC transporter substrate-binding protein [Massilia terrae]
MPKRLLAALLLCGAVLTASAGEITVSAAASLTDAFKEIATHFEAQHQGTTVLLNFGASGALVQQIAKGAPVDVFASADQLTMDIASNQNLLAPGERHDFARNNLVVVVPIDSKLVLRDLAGLRQPAVHRIAAGNPSSVPVGRYTREALEAQHLWNELGPRLVLAQNVRQALDYVARGEADAGFVYATDAAIAKGQVKLALQVPLARPVTYPIALVNASTNKEEARRFIAYVLSPEAQAVLAKYGFSRP